MWVYKKSRRLKSRKWDSGSLVKLKIECKWPEVSGAENVMKDDF